jgi:hypothetical protein
MKEDSINNLLKSLQSFVTDKKFSEAHEFIDLNLQKFDLPVYHYNKALIYFNAEDYAMARSHGELAEKMGFASPVVSKLIQTSKNNLGIMSIEKDNGFYEKLNQGIYQNNIDFYAYISLVLLVVWVSFLKRMHNHLVRIVVLIVSFVPVFGYYTHFNQFQDIILTGETSVYEGASQKFNLVSELPLGVKLKVKLSQNEWNYIQFPSHLRGWFKGSDYFILKGQGNE